MLRRFNYTGRRKINRVDIGITLRQESGQPWVFDPDLSKLREYEFPPEADVCIEAYTKYSLQQFKCGTIGSIVYPSEQNRRLVEIGADMIPQFRVKVSKLDGLILGLADRIQPLTADENVAESRRRGIINIQPAALGEELWALDFNFGSHPILKINERIEAAKDFAKHDPLFIATVYPAVVTEVLTHILFIESYRPDEDEPEAEDRWKRDWITFAQRLPGIGPIPSLESDDDADRERVEAWIEDARECFCRKLGLSTRFVNSREAPQE